jgi:hypothetical protein
VSDPAEDIFQIRGFPAPAGTDKYKFDLYFFGLGIDKRQSLVPLVDEFGWTKPLKSRPTV